jgi:folate-dependent phosphoribosylglycinamide formyltransferase PurN
MGGHLSLAPLQKLIQERIAVRAVVVPSPARLVGAPLSADVPPVVERAPTGQAGRRGMALPIAGHTPFSTIAEVAADHGIPLLEVSGLGDVRTVARLQAYHPDAICVACFPWRIPSALLALPRLGCLNLHPTLLPANRGPDPLFWTFHQGDEQSGATIHLMEARFDAGPIVAQRALPLHDGITEAELERACAELGGTLMVEALDALDAGTAHPQPQDEAAATYFYFPQERDYLVTPERSARWAHRFVSGICGRGVPIRAVVQGQRFRVLTSLGTEPLTEDTLPWHLAQGVLRMRCAGGIWVARAYLEELIE